MVDSMGCAYARICVTLDAGHACDLPGQVACDLAVSATTSAISTSTSAISATTSLSQRPSQPLEVSCSSERTRDWTCRSCCRCCRLRKKSQSYYPRGQECRRAVHVLYMQQDYMVVKTRNDSMVTNGCQRAEECVCDSRPRAVGAVFRVSADSFGEEGSILATPVSIDRYIVDWLMNYATSE